MPRECTRAVLHLSGDVRLVPGVGATIAYFAERAGLAQRSCNLLVAALEEFCLDVLPSVQDSGEPLDVAIEDFEDRIQIVVEHRDQHVPDHGTHSAGSAKSGVETERVTLSRLARVVDRVECDTRNGSIRTTLVKFL